MKTSTSLALALAAGSTFAAGALADQPTNLGTNRLHHYQMAGTIYINLATGERTMVPTGSSVRASSTNVWDNKDVTSNGNFFSSIDDTTGGVFGDEWLDWGDIGRGTTDPLSTDIDCYVFAYATTVRGATSTVLGLTAVNSWYDDESGFGDTTFSPVTAIGVTDLPGATPSLPPGFGSGWIITVDLSGSTLTFTLAGADEDAGGTSDFGYSYSFDQTAITGTQGLLGPLLILPFENGPEGLGFPTGANGTSYGVEDAFDIYANGPAVGGTGHDITDYLGTFFFGGWVFGVPVTDPAFVPFSSFPMTLFGPETGGGGCPCDINGDGGVDVGDFFAFVLAFASGDPAADCDGSGGIDVADFFCFVLCFADPAGAGCP